MRIHLISAWRAARHSSGSRLVTCPENGQVAAVRFNRFRAVLTALRGGKPDLPLAGCSRWSDRGPCDQKCVPEATMPDSAIVNIVTRWSAGQRCVLCHAPLVESSLARHHVGLRSSAGETVEWPDVAPEALPQTLQARQPVCWNCHIGETFRRRYPHLVVDR